MDSNTLDSPLACDHTPTKVSVLRTKHSYRIRCFKCGHYGPEKEDPEGAWAAFLGRTSELVEDRG